MDIRKYRVTNVQRRDEWQSRFGTMVDYAIALEGEEGWIQLSQKVETRPPQIGDELEGYIENKTNTNGTPYRKFKKESAQFSGAGRSSDPPINSNLEHKLNYAVQMLEELTGRRDAADQTTQPSNEELDDPFKDLKI